MDTIVPVNKSIKNSFPEGIDRILRYILTLTGFLADNGLDLHISATEIQRLFHHFRDGSTNALIVDEPCRVLTYIADFSTRHNNCRNTQLREKTLWVKTKVKNCCQCWNTMSCDVQHLQGLRLCKPRKTRSA